ncbi:MAG TPA: deoxyribodipyrimidine photo-lyase [Bacteroidales bacterium]|nr:deoxyribodipyrimidine photo-lyase [Bacteroidales bacterium]
MKENELINVFWFRRDLRLDDNTGLDAALRDGLPVLPLFIFDRNITDDLNPGDARISFIYNTLLSLNRELAAHGSSLLIRHDFPDKTWEEIAGSYRINKVFFNRDYEPYAKKRDKEITESLKNKGISVQSFKDQVIFEEKDVVKPDGLPYTMFTPYKNAWMRKLAASDTSPHQTGNQGNFFKQAFIFPGLKALGFKPAAIEIPGYNLSNIKEYHRYRDFPAADRTTHLGPHLRFGTVSIRKITERAVSENSVFLGELVWREFFMQILFNFPHVVTGNFRTKYDNVSWRNNEEEFRRWCNGETGYPLVDAGMRQMNETGFMHNRVRMITAGFLCKHLLTAWWYGEAYFAEKLNDYELSSNNGNWQWVAGTGCDAAQYFRVFNPLFQQKKFDPRNEYVKKWVPDFDKSTYPKPMVEHGFARERAIEAYLKG